jgi:recombination protein RecA
MQESHRQRVIREKVARMEPARAATLSTGFASLDAATGGLPRGRLVEIFGGSGTGKTTLALQIVAKTQQGGGAAWIDAEHTFDPAYAAGLGVDVERLVVAQPQSAEQAFEIMRQLALSGAVDLLVVDSAAALVPEVELQTGIGKSGPGAHTRALSSGLRKVSAALRTSGATAILLNQTRAHEEFETSAGGAPLKLFAAIRVSLHRAMAGGIRFRVLKNKATEPFRDGLLLWENGRGFTESP